MNFYYRTDRMQTMTVRDDTVHIGCQTISRIEIERIAEQMGWM